ncbi:MAG: electron transporter RnfD [Roseburia sp.]
MWISPDNELLEYSGRIDFDNPKEPVLVFAASYVKMRFRGTSCSVELTNKRAYWTNYMGYILDGKQEKIALSQEEKKCTYLLAEGLEDGEHELLLFKRTDSCHIVTFHGFEVGGAAEVLPLPPKPKRQIEVFGDSVSCGEVSEALDYVGKEDPEHDGEFSNSWFSYAWITARKLNAELHDTSQGGIALLDGTGWFGAPDYIGMESCYDKIEYYPQLSEVKQWDFKKYIPQVVVVAIGQNDNHPNDYMAENPEGEQAKNWKKHYEGFIRALLEVYPKSQIILTTTLLCHHPAWDEAIEEVCNRFREERVHHFRYQRNGRGTPGHLRIPEAEEMAEELTAYINELGDAIWF